MHACMHACMYVRTYVDMYVCLRRFFSGKLQSLQGFGLGWFGTTRLHPGSISKADNSQRWV